MDLWKLNRRHERGGVCGREKDAFAGHELQKGEGVRIEAQANRKGERN